MHANNVLERFILAEDNCSWAAVALAPCAIETILATLTRASVSKPMDIADGEENLCTRIYVIVWHQAAEMRLKGGIGGCVVRFRATVLG